MVMEWLELIYLMSAQSTWCPLSYWGLLLCSNMITWVNSWEIWVHLWWCSYNIGFCFRVCPSAFWALKVKKKNQKMQIISSFLHRGVLAGIYRALANSFSSVIRLLATNSLCIMMYCKTVIKYHISESL